MIELKYRHTVCAKKLLSEYNKSIVDPDTFYSKGFINWNGLIKGTDTPASDEIAQKLLAEIEAGKFRIKRIPQNDREYFVDSHEGMYEKSDNDYDREEEHLAMDMFKKEDYDDSDIDGFMDYQTPLCRDSDLKEKLHIGKIDLLAIKQENGGGRVIIMELKKRSSDETLLRCVLEAYTYREQVDKEKLLTDFSGKNLGNHMSNLDLKDYTIEAAVLVFADQVQHKQYQSDKYKNVKELMKKLGIGLYIIHGSNEKIERIERVE